MVPGIAVAIDEKIENGVIEKVFSSQCNLALFYSSIQVARSLTYHLENIQYWAFEVKIYQSKDDTWGPYSTSAYKKTSQLH